MLAGFFCAGLSTLLRLTTPFDSGLMGLTNQQEKVVIMANSSPYAQFDLLYIIQNIPGFVYWKNIHSEYMGCNDNFLYLTGLTRNEILGKTDNDFFWSKEYADNFREYDQDVMSNREIKIYEHQLLINPECNHYIFVRTEKKPFYNAENDIIGVLAIVMDITDQKNNKSLNIANKAACTQIQEQEKFRKIVGQVVHDIGSPLASLATMLELDLALSEQERITLNDIVTRISDIAENLLNFYRPEKTAVELAKGRKPLLIYLVLLKLLAEKRYQHHGRLISFETDFQPGCHFVFAELEECPFRCMLSNLVNNAVDAFDDQPGVVTVGFAMDDELVKINVQDNGKGMSQAVIDKIINNIAVTEGKADGHGIGLTQVRETLQRNQGSFAIDSETGKGTTIHLTFPRSRTPDWVATQITVNREDTVVILDDEPTIHTAWNSHFTAVVPDISLVHFTQSDEALAFINGFAQKEQILLLTGYELLKQPYNGLEVIEQTRIKRAVLVTSHHDNWHIREQAVRLGVTVLPKQLAAEVPINHRHMNTDLISDNA